MSKLKCIFCNRLTSVKETNIESKVNGKIIGVKAVPVHACKFCNEIFYTDELKSIIQYALDNLSDKKQIILFEDAQYEYQKNRGKIEAIKELRSMHEDKPKREGFFILQDIFDGGYYKNCIRCQEEKLTYEQIEEDSSVLVYHHSNLKPLKGTIIKKQNQVCSLRLPKTFIMLNFLVGDPIVIKFTHNDLGYNIGGEIKNINKRDNTFDFFSNILYIYKDQRDNGIPVSIFSEISDLRYNDRHEGIIKDLSKQGLLLCTKDKFVEGFRVELCIHTSLKLITLTGTIMTEYIEAYNNKYGIEIVKISKEDLYYFKKYIMDLQI
jgi:YgiT-type zinc finger domain-containing protein